MNAAATPAERADVSRKRCPICGKPPTEKTTPFCSKRCADVDLHRWLGGIYVVPDDEPGSAETTPESER